MAGLVGSEAAEPLDEGEGLDELSSTARIHKLLANELGEEMADAFAQTRVLQERLARRLHPDEGLREQKKRLTRQRISDVATTLFLVRGFEHVTVSEIARIVGVSEKTVFNYFPTKESLVFDRADEGVERLTAALRERDAGESPTKAMLRALNEEPEELEQLPDAIHMFMPLFSEMIAATPALHAAWLALHARLVEVATQALAEHAEVDPRDPEPIIAARAIVGLLEVEYASRIRHIEAGLRGTGLREAVNADVERAARMLDTGLWSFGLLTQGARTRTQLREAAAAAEEARTQVIDALKHARSAWQELRQNEQQERRAHDRDERAKQRERRKREQAELKQEIKQAAKRVATGERGAAKRGASRAGEVAWQAARKQGKKSLREAGAIAQRAAFEAFRQKLGERHEAIREREVALRRDADDR
ncbi:MAG TPA: TetR family transcriptional regulator [Solirubrobacteraceae bacterium]|jgi:AcrR family transcriptional regulator